MNCPMCGLDKFFIDGNCGICHFSQDYELAEIEHCAEEDF